MAGTSVTTGLAEGQTRLPGHDEFDDVRRAARAPRVRSAAQRRVSNQSAVRRVSNHEAEALAGMAAQIVGECPLASRRASGCQGIYSQYVLTPRHGSKNRSVKHNNGGGTGDIFQAAFCLFVGAERTCPRRPGCHSLTHGGKAVSPQTVTVQALRNSRFIEEIAYG